jgi:hypothetical protein
MEREPKPVDSVTTPWRDGADDFLNDLSCPSLELHDDAVAFLQSTSAGSRRSKVWLSALALVAVAVVGLRLLYAAAVTLLAALH